MLIVSQDKKEIVNFDSGFCLNILTGATKQVINIDGHKIGEYKTEERAKEILEEIVKCKTGIFAVLYERPMCNGEKIEKAKLNKKMLDRLNNVVIDSGEKIETLQGTKVYYMPEE